MRGQSSLHIPVVIPGDIMCICTCQFCSYGLMMPNIKLSRYMWTRVCFSPVATLGSCMQEVGMRVVATLEWLNGSHQLEYARNPTHVQLNKMLVLLLNNLVAGHLLDPQLDTQKLYDMMAPPLLTNKTPLGRLKFPPLSSLQAVVLRKGQGMASNMGAGNAHTVAQALSGIGLQDCTNVPRTGHMALSSKLNPKANTFKPRSQGVLVRNQV